MWLLLSLALSPVLCLLSCAQTGPADAFMQISQKEVTLRSLATVLELSRNSVCMSVHECSWKCVRILRSMLPITKLFKATKLENQLCVTLRAPAHSQGLAYRDEELLHSLLSLLHDVRGRKYLGILVGVDQPAWLTSAGNAAVLNTKKKC